MLDKVGEAMVDAVNLRYVEVGNLIREETDPEKKIQLYK